MRPGRLLLGSVVILGALWVLVGEQMAGASADAVVNARLSTLRAPIAGTLALPDRALGSRVRQGEELGSLNDPLADAIRLNDLQMERRLAQAELARAEALVEGTGETVAALDDRTRRYAAARLAEIEDRLEHARARLAVLEGSSRSSASERTPEGDLETLLDEGQSASGADAAVAPVALEYARERTHVLELSLEAARDGVFLGDGFNDAPFSEQRAEERRAALREQKARRDEAAARVAALDSRIAQETLAVSRLRAEALRSTVDGQVWELRAADGEHLERGQDVMVLLDCDTLLVTLSVTESIFNGLSVGDAARFRLSGDGRDFPATVIRLAGSGAETIYRNLAVAPSEKHLERYDVALLVPGLAAAEGLSCPVGRTGRAFFETRPLDWLRGL